MKRNLWLALLIYFSILALGHFRHGSIDAIQRLHLTRALAFDHSVITEKYGPIKYSPLQSILMIPPYALGYSIGKAIGNQEENAHRVGYRFSAFLYNPLVVTATCVLYFNILMTLGMGASVSLLSTYLLLFGTLMLPYSRIMFSEPTSALLILVSVYALLRASQKWQVGKMFLGLLALGLLSLNNLLFSILYLTVFAYAVWDRYRSQKTRELKLTCIVGTGIFLLIGAVWVLYNYARYGSPVAFGYAGEGFSNPLLIGLYGLTFSIGRGMVFYSVLSALAVGYFLLNYERLEPACRRILTVYLVGGLMYLLSVSKWHSFEGGWSWGPRFVLPFVPLIHLVFPFILEGYKSYNRVGRFLLIAVCSYAVLMNGYEFIGAYQKYEVVTFKSGEIPYRFSVFLPEYSVLFNNWDMGALVKRFPQFVAVAVVSLYVLMVVLRRRLWGEERPVE